MTLVCPYARYPRHDFSMPLCDFPNHTIGLHCDDPNVASQAECVHSIKIVVIHSLHMLCDSLSHDLLVDVCSLFSCVKYSEADDLLCVK